MQAQNAMQVFVTSQVNWVVGGHTLESYSPGNITGIGSSQVGQCYITIHGANFDQLDL